MKEEKLDRRKLRFPLKVERKHLGCELLKLLKDLHEILPLIIWPGRPEIIECTHKITTTLEDIKLLSTSIVKELDTVRTLYQNASEPMLKTSPHQVEFHKVINKLEKLLNQKTDEKGYYKEKQSKKYESFNLLDPNSKEAKKLPNKN
tara:strand:+ start:149 stop:589 length:441 start_codon:yes stop_codon:yes gene_type:complete